MNKNAIQKFAVWARVQLIGAVKQRAFAYEITGGGDKPELDAVGGRLLTNAEKSQRRELIGEIRRKGFDQVMEEAAYTWFNRFIALRFMEVNNYLPSKVRLFTDENGAFKPQILKEAMTVELDGLDRGIVLGLLDKQENEALYKYLLITQCNALNAALPGMFEKIANWTELLFPDNLLRADNVLGRMISDIPEEDWKDAVQIIGWLYQYYNTELKDDTFAQLKKNVKITKERIPAATQLFTPDWIVRYMVENSLGRLWLEGHPNAELHDGWKYYLDEAEQERSVEAQLAKLREEYKTIKPEEIKVIDPCMGSGHILVYAFDVLMQIYTSAGWDQREAAQSILKNNLYGLDIDDRAAQLAYFAVMMKARQYDRRLLTRGIQPNIHSIIESNALGGAYKLAMGDFLLSKEHQETLNYLLDAFIDAKEYGSILCLEKRDYVGLLRAWNLTASQTTENLNLTLWFAAVEHEIPKLIEQAIILTQGYDVVVTNPPYMAVSNAGAKVNDYVKKNFPDSKADLFAVFIERCGQMAKKNGYQAMITQHAWMFLSSFEKLRTKLLAVDIVNMAHLGTRAFEEIGGEVVQTTSFVIRKSHIADYKGEYCRLIEPTSQQGKEDMFLAGENRYAADQSNFSKIPGSPVAYWVSENVFTAFSFGKLFDVGMTRRGLQTGDKDRFIRYWFEPKASELQLPKESLENYKWVIMNNGGNARKWYGEITNAVLWENNGKVIKSTGKAIIPSEELYFRECITWNRISVGNLSVKYQEPGIIQGDMSPFFISYEESMLNYIIGLMNSIVSTTVIHAINPTITMPVGDIAKLPVKMCAESKEKIDGIVQDNILNSRIDWDSYETSWDFKRNPLV